VPKHPTLEIRRWLQFEDYLLLLAIVLLPWAFGGVEIWASRTAALLLVSGSSVALFRRGWAGWGLGRESRWLLPAFMLAGWGALQLVPLPPALLQRASPAAFELYQQAFPGYGDPTAKPTLESIEELALARVPENAGHPLPEEATPIALELPACYASHWRPISIQPSATAERLTWYIALLLAFLTLRERFREPARRTIYLWALFLSCGLLAAFGLLQMQFWNRRIYWVRRMLVLAEPFGPYINPTNFASLMEMVVPVMAGYAWTRFRRQGRDAVYEKGCIIALALAGLCSIAAFAAASKLAAGLLALFLFLMGIVAVRSHKQRLWLSLGALVTGALTVPVILATALGSRIQLFVGRLGDENLLEGRGIIWRSSIEMAHDYRWFGAGFGSFRQIFERYVPAGSPMRWAHAHNDYIELLLDGGIIAGLLVLWLAFGFVRQAVRRLRLRRPVSPLRLGLCAGVLALAVHATMDFNHQIPANALIWLVLCAFLVPLSRQGDGAQVSP